MNNLSIEILRYPTEDDWKHAMQDEQKKLTKDYKRGRM